MMNSKHIYIKRLQKSLLPINNMSVLVKLISSDFGNG